MNNILSLLDSYKISHVHQYPEGTEMVYSNWTIRGSRYPVNYYIFFGLQYYVKEYLIKRWKEEFFDLPKEEALARFRKTLKNSLNVTDLKHYEELHDLGYLPIEIKALPEGSKVDLRVPCFTLRNTNPKFYWITNMLETVTSCVIWGMINNATVASMYAGVRRKYLAITDSVNHPMEPFLNHNFAYRGMMGNEAAITTDAAWLLFSKGSDTIPGIEFMEDYYGADSNKELISASIPATEHSVACAGGKDNEADTYRRMIDLYKDSSKIFSFVSDSWDYWHFLNVTVRENKQYLLDSGCKCVFRPDSSPKTPLEIICGDPEAPAGTPENLGSLEVLWDIFGGSLNEKGYKVLHPQVGLIYGEAISVELYEKICEKMVSMGFSVTNLVVGVGSFSQTFCTRDNLKQAFKATAVTINGELREIFKDPKTDTSGKKSAKGLLQVQEVLKEVDSSGKLAHSHYVLKDQCTWEEEGQGALKTIFKDGELVNEVDLQTVRNRINKLV